MPRAFWDDGYGTHLPALLDALNWTTGPVLEMGAGFWSTPVLHQICFDRELVTLEPVASWLIKFRSMVEGSRINSRSEEPRPVHRLESSLKGEDIERWWGVVLVDGPVETRVPALDDIKADVYVVHDTEPNHGMLYEGMQERLEQFKYRKDYKDLYPHTTLVSDYLDFNHGMVWSPRPKS